MTAFAQAYMNGNWSCHLCKTATSGQESFVAHVKGSKHSKKLQAPMGQEMRVNGGTNLAVTAAPVVNCIKYILACILYILWPLLVLTGLARSKDSDAAGFLSSNLVSNCGPGSFHCEACPCAISGMENVRQHCQGKGHKKKLDAKRVRRRPF